MQTYIELRESATKIAHQARAKFEEIKDDTLEVRAAEIEAEFDKMMADHDTLQSKAERALRLEKAEAASEAGDAREPRGETRSFSAAEEARAPRYRSVFHKYLGGGVAGLSSAETAVLRGGQTDPDASETRAMSAIKGAGDTAGGYLVPEDFSGEIEKNMAVWGPMWDGNIVREVVTEGGNPLVWPTLDDVPITTTQLLNKASIKAESAPALDDGSRDPVFGQIKFGAEVLNTGVVRIPMELLQDSYFDIEKQLAEMFSERLGRVANHMLTRALIVGAGTKTVAAAKTVLKSDELLDLLHSVDPAYRDGPRCRWQFNDATLAALRKLKDGQGNYLWQMGDIRAEEPNRLLGHPYSINQAMPNIEAASEPIAFGDHSRFVLRKVRGFRLITLRERYAENFQVGMVAFKRFEGKVINDKAIKTLSMAI